MDEQHQADTPAPVPRPRRKTKWGLAIFALLVIAAVCALAGLRSHFPRFVRDRIVSTFSSAPGVETRFDDIRFRLWAGQLEAGRLAVSAVEGGSRQETVAWQGLDIFVDPLSLLGSLVRVSNVTLDAPVCHLVQEADGGMNLDKLLPKSKGGEQSSGESLDKGVVVGQVAIRNGLFTFRDHTVDTTPAALEVRAINASGRVH